MPSEINQSAGWQNQFLDQEPIVQMSLCLVFHSAGLAEVSEEYGQAAMFNYYRSEPTFPWGSCVSMSIQVEGRG